MVGQKASLAKTVVRKIYFFRIDAVDEKGSSIAFDPTRVLEHIKSLPWTTRERYLEDNEGRVTCCWVDEIGPPHKLRIGDIRTSDLPQVEDTGELSPLGIPDDSGLAEQVHVIFFKDGIVGAEFNFFGPRISRLSNYLPQKAESVCPKMIYFRPLLRQDILDQLDRFKDIRLFNLKINSSYTSIIKKANEDLGSAFEAAAKIGGNQELEIILKPTRRTKGKLSKNLLTVAKQLFSRQDLRNGASRFIVTGYDGSTGRTEQLDLLNDKLIAKKEIVLLLEGRTWALDSNSAYAAIQASYDELYEQIKDAAGIK
jgi:hypothetical protein